MAGTEVDGSVGILFIKKKKVEQILQRKGLGLETD